MIVHQKPNKVGIKLGKNLLESTADGVSDILILTDLQGIIIRRNKASHHRFHAIYGEILGRNIDVFFQETLAACSKQ